MKSSLLRACRGASALLAALLATLLAAACTSPPPDERSSSSAGMQPAKLSPARAGTLNACADFVDTFGHAATAIDSAQRVAAGPVRPSTIAQPEHCLVKGRLHAREAARGRAFAIGFEMRLPVICNGRLHHQGNGGLDREVLPALGAPASPTGSIAAAAADRPMSSAKRSASGP